MWPMIWLLSRFARGDIRFRFLEVAVQQRGVGSDREEIRSEFIVKLASNIATLLVLDHDHVACELLIFTPRFLQGSRQQVKTATNAFYLWRPDLGDTQIKFTV